MADEFAELGAVVPADVVQTDEAGCSIWEENVISLNAFIALETQWRRLAIVGLGGGAIVRTGLDYAAVDVLMRRRGIDDAVFDDVMVMEQAALHTWNAAE